MEDEWLESPTKVKKDKKDKRRRAKQAPTTSLSGHTIVTPERSSNKVTGFWSIADINKETPKPLTALNDNDSDHDSYVPVNDDSKDGTPHKSENSEEPPDPPEPTTTHRDNDWDYDMIDDKTSPIGHLMDYLLEKNPKELIPNTAPTRLDLIRFKLNLVEALSKCEGSTELEGGHAYLILSETEYRDWIGNTQASLPTKPTVPALPEKAEDMTSAMVFYIRRAKTARALHKAYEQQTKDILERKFPNGSIGLRDHTGKIPYGTTALTILKNIYSKVKDDMEDNQLHMEIVTGIMGKTYTPGKDGAAIYFQDIEDDQHLLRELNRTILPYSLLIPKAQEVFHTQHELKDMTKIACKWKQLVNDNTYLPETTESWEAFKEHYKHELKLLHMQLTDKQSKGKARYSADTTWRHNMQDELDATREDLDTVSVTLRSVLSEQASMHKPNAPTTVTVPTAALSTVGSALTPGTLQGGGLEQLTAALVAALQASNGNQCHRETTRQRSTKTDTTT